MFAKILCVGMVCAAAFLAAGGVAGAAERSTCNTSGLASTAAASEYQVVSLVASGVPCSKARSVAREVADELRHGKPISLSGVQGFAINTTTCAGCKTTTQVALSYAKGKITISLGGKASSSPAPSPSAPGSGPLVLA